MIFDIGSSILELIWMNSSKTTFASKSVFFIYLFSSIVNLKLAIQYVIKLVYSSLKKFHLNFRAEMLKIRDSPETYSNLRRVSLTTCAHTEV